MSEVSPTLGCSIEISHDIQYVCRFVYGKPIHKICMPKMRGLNCVAQKRACSKSVWGSKQTCDTRVFIVGVAYFYYLLWQQDFIC